MDLINLGDFSRRKYESKSRGTSSSYLYIFHDYHVNHLEDEVIVIHLYIPHFFYLRKRHCYVLPTRLERLEALPSLLYILLTAAIIMGFTPSS